MECNPDNQCLIANLRWASGKESWLPGKLTVIRAWNRILKSYLKRQAKKSNLLEHGMGFWDCCWVVSSQRVSPWCWWGRAPPGERWRWQVGRLSLLLSDQGGLVFDARRRHCFWSSFLKQELFLRICTSFTPSWANLYKNDYCDIFKGFSARVQTSVPAYPSTYKGVNFPTERESL